MKHRLFKFLIMLLLFVSLTLLNRGLDYFLTIDEERIRWFLAIAVAAGFVALFPEKKR